MPETITFQGVEFNVEPLPDGKFRLTALTPDAPFPELIVARLPSDESLLPGNDPLHRVDMKLPTYDDPLPARSFPVDPVPKLEDDKGFRMALVQANDRGLLNPPIDPKQFPVRGVKDWSANRAKAKWRRYRAKKGETRSKEENTARWNKWGSDNPDKVIAHNAARGERAKKTRADKQFVAIDSEGFDTHNYYTDDRKKAKEKRDGLRRIVSDDYAPLADRAVAMEKLSPILRDKKIEDDPFEGWTLHDRNWYLSQHEPGYIPNARTKTYPGDIHREHRLFLLGAGNDRKIDWLCASKEKGKKVALKTRTILDWILSLKAKFPNATFVSYSFSYDVCQILRDIPYEKAYEIQKGEILREDEDEDDESDEVSKLSRYVFWGKYGISFRRQKEFCVGLLRNPSKP